MSTVRKGQKVLGFNGALGTTTGGKRPCSLKGCKGPTIAVRWEDRTLSYCCMSSMTFKNDVWKVTTPHE